MTVPGTDGLCRVGRIDGGPRALILTPIAAAPPLLDRRAPGRAARAGPVLREVDLGEALLVRVVRVVVLVAVDERDEVRVLRDRAAFPQIREDRALVVALLDGAGELGHREDRDVEVAREHLQRARD